MKITEKDRNKALILLIQRLFVNNDTESIDLLKIIIDDDKPSIHKSFEIMTGQTIRPEE